jgi:hypothetical protein
MAVARPEDDLRVLQKLLHSMAKVTDNMLVW